MKTILLLEDEPKLARFVQINLEAEGYTVVIDFETESALRHVGERTPDLVLLDLMLASGSAWEFMERLKERPQSRDIPVVVLSALASREDKSRAFSAGVMDYLVKPISADELVAEVARWVRPEENGEEDERETRYDTDRR